MSIDLKNVNTEVLIETVERMRAAQKRYYATKNGTDLCAARDLERRVDVLLRAIREAQERAENPGLWSLF